MEITQLSSQVFVSPQITANDLGDLSKFGIRSVINNRPDGEAAGQPKSAELAAAAAELGMAFVHIPIVTRAITEQDVAEFEHACNSMEAPILLFCRSGTRSAMLWNMIAHR